MNVIGIAGLALVSAVTAVMLRRYNQEYAMVVNITVGVIILVQILADIVPAICQINGLLTAAQMSAEYGIIPFKAPGICLLAQFAADSCRDAGESALASKVELAGKTSIIILALPLFEKIASTALVLIGGQTVKKVICIVFLLFLSMIFVYVQSVSQDELYRQQYEDSGAADLSDGLPEETREWMDSLGILSPDRQSILNLTPETIFEQTGSPALQQSAISVRALLSILAVILLCAPMNGMKLSLDDRLLSGVIGMVGTLCICTVVIQPIVTCIENVALVIKGVTGFLLASIPIPIGIMIAGGQMTSAGSYNLLMLGAGNVISVIASTVLVPLFNIFLAFSVVSAVSPAMNLGGLRDLFSRTVKWVLTSCMTIFLGLLTTQTVVSSAADGAGIKAVRFMVSAFVPVVGSAPSDATGSVQSSVKLPKSGVGVLELLVTGATFLPAALECLTWLLTLTACAAAGDIFELREITTLLRSSMKMIQILLSTTPYCLVILMISVVLMIAMGGAVT